jgi:hypothetical protein
VEKYGLITIEIMILSIFYFDNWNSLGTKLEIFDFKIIIFYHWGRHGRNHMVFGFTTI